MFPVSSWDRVVTDDDLAYSGRERRSKDPLAERVTRLETIVEELAGAVQGQEKRDARIHRDLLRLIRKQDKRMDVEHVERVQLVTSLRVTFTIIGIVVGAFVFVANIVGPYVVKHLP